MRKRAKGTLLCFFILTALPAAAQAPAAFPGLEPDPRAEAFARRERNGGYGWEDLAEISLWASGAEGPGPLLERIRAAAAELAAETAALDLPAPRSGAGARALGEYVLSFMHRKFLKSYSLPQTRVDTMLANGRYNCVSSAVLYLILARSAGLELRGVMTKDHAFAAVNAGGEWVDVETTNPYGFDPGNRKDFHDRFGRVTGFAYVPAKNYRDRAFISPLELVSLILSNRVAALEKAGRFAEAVPLAIDRAALLGGGGTASSEFFEDPHRDMMNRVFNYGAFLGRAGREEDALRWAAYAGAKYPDEERWQEFIAAAVNNRLVKFFRQKDAAGGREFLAAHAALLNQADYRRFDALTTDAELTERVSGLRDAADAGALLDAVDAAEKQTLLAGERAVELRTAVIGKTAELLAAGKGADAGRSAGRTAGGGAANRPSAARPAADWSAAIAYLESALTRYGPNRQLEQMLGGYRSNHAVEFHNRFAAAYNRKDFEEAEKILAEGLALYPDNRQLLADRRTAEKNFNH
ncbi:MAG: hypothetical protein LBQ55_10360 [Treponema sp.]|jgi:tetratricopeptide (TPR) repeat protein|nr:hypothetical protein [Treponema sp.]